MAYKSILQRSKVHINEIEKKKEIYIYMASNHDRFMVLKAIIIAMIKNQIDLINGNKSNVKCPTQATTCKDRKIKETKKKQREQRQTASFTDICTPFNMANDGNKWLM